MTRLRANGGYIDAPDDGRTDVRPSREKAIDIPVVMLLRQEGKKMSILPLVRTLAGTMRHSTGLC